MILTDTVHDWIANKLKSPRIYDRGKESALGSFENAKFLLFGGRDRRLLPPLFYHLIQIRLVNHY